VPKISRVRKPVTIAHGDADEMIPLEQSQRLFEAANAPKKFRLRPGTTHGSPLRSAAEALNGGHPLPVGHDRCAGSQLRRPNVPCPLACVRAGVQRSYEARNWAEAAAGFERGERTIAEMAALSSAAWAFYRGRVDSDSWAIQCGLLVVMTSLGVGFDVNRWGEGAWHFLNCCEAAGVSDTTLSEMLVRHFGPLLPEQNHSDPCAPDPAQTSTTLTA
jgi:hypothetical protein